MKKTLAAILAAAMALSTATVAFAANKGGSITSSKDVESDVDASEASTEYSFGKEVKLYLSLTTEEVTELDTGMLANLINDGIVKTTITVTDGRSAFKTLPKVDTVKKDKKWATELKFEFSHTYKTDSVNTSFRVKLTAAKDCYVVGVAKEPIAKDGTVEDSNIEYKFVSKKPTVVDPADKAVKKGDAVTEPVQILKKGDVYTSEDGDYAYKLEYSKPEYSEDITIIAKDNTCVIKNSDLYKELSDDHKVAFWFDNNAVFEVKISSADKAVNLYYDTDEVDWVIDAYGDYADEFEFLTFRTTTNGKFINSGKLSFDALNGSKTSVYKVVSGAGGLDDGDYLELVDSSYADGIVTVSNVKNLSGTYVITSEPLPAEDLDEPVDNAPSVEPDEPATPAAPADEENPKTGAC